MKDGLFTVSENAALAKNVFRMRLCGDTSAVTRPGQFVNIRIDGLYLRRPLSVCDISGDELTVIYKVVGIGTEKLSRTEPGAKLQMMTGLGNGFDISSAGENPVLIGGGSGIPPLYLLAKHLISAGIPVHVILGFNSCDEIFYENEFKALGCSVDVTTLDGSYGIKGYVTDAAVSDFSYFYTCGPESMLRAVYEKLQCSGQLSFDRRMGCGFGACMGCSCKTITGGKRICREGPVLYKEEIIWEG